MSTNLQRESQKWVVLRELIRSEELGRSRLNPGNIDHKKNAKHAAVEQALTRYLGEPALKMRNQGCYFAGPELTARIRQLTQVRTLLEIEAIRLCIASGREQEIEALYEICDDFSSLVAKGYLAGACEADLEFHKRIVCLSGSPVLQYAYTFSNIPEFHERISDAKRLLEDYESTDREHRLLVNAMISGDLSKSEKTLNDHIERESRVALHYYRECV